MRANLLPRIACGIVLLGLGVGLIVGCGTPRERYRTLSVFFDGVPDPDAVKKTTNGNLENVPVIARHVTQHPPYRDNNCAVCHHAANGDVQDFSEAYKQCVKCHKTVASEHALMHGPVVREACKWCHTPHESAEPALLKDTPIKVCTQCHDKELLGPKPAEHRDGTTSCLQCHSGHGGDARYFLTAATQPAPSASAPASMPATQPALRLPPDSAATPQDAPAQMTGKEPAP